MIRYGHIGFWFAVMLFVACEDNLQYKRNAAELFSNELMATEFSVGMVQDTIAGGESMMTVLTYTGCNDNFTAAEMERRANSVARDFYIALEGREEIAGEKHLKIICVTGSKVQFEYFFHLDELKRVEEYIQVADEMLDALMLNDSLAIDSLKDDMALPDSLMDPIYAATAKNDSLVFYLKDSNRENLGFRLTDDKQGQRVYSANYEYSTDDYVTYYIINVDCKTKKVVYIWMKTDPK